MYDELLCSPTQRLFAHSLLLLMCCGFGFGLIAAQAGEQRWSRLYTEAELKQPAAPDGLEPHLTLPRGALCLLHVHSPTVNQSWLKVRVQLINADTGALGAEQHLYLSKYMGLIGGKSQRRGEDTREVFMRVPAGRWHLRVTGEAPPDPAPTMRNSRLWRGADGQFNLDPGAFVPPTPIFDLTGTRTLARDETARVTLTTDVLMSRYGVLLGFIALLLFGVLMMVRSFEVNRQREQQELRVQLLTQQAISKLLAHNVNPRLAQATAPHMILAPQAPAEDHHLSLTHALAAAVIIVSALVGVAAASMYGVV